MRYIIFYFSSILINTYLNCPVVESNRQMELDVVLDMNKVITELIDFILTVWPEDNNFLSSIQSMKYPIPHKIAIKKWLPRLYISLVSMDLVILPFLIDTKEPFDMEKLIFQVILSNAKDVQKEHS